MSKVAVVYWSGTGNTQKMAEAVVDGAKQAGAEVKLFKASEFTANMVDEFDGIAFGCPSMGAEVLEESEFEPMFSSCKSKLNNKNITLFGSYGWGDGEWMRDWEDSCNSYGAKLVSESVICNETPDDEGINNCKFLGEVLAKS